MSAELGGADGGVYAGGGEGGEVWGGGEAVGGN